MAKFKVTVWARVREIYETEIEIEATDAKAARAQASEFLSSMPDLDDWTRVDADRDEWDVSSVETVNPKG